MIVRNEGSTFPVSELELPTESLEEMSFAGPKPSTWAMIGHPPVVHCSSGVSVLPLPEQTCRCGMLDEKTFGL